MSKPKRKTIGGREACPHGLLFCPTCLGARNPHAVEARRRKAGPMKDRRKKRVKQKERNELRREVEG